jgi:hypothetical protein
MGDVGCLDSNPQEDENDFGRGFERASEQNFPVIHKVGLGRPGLRFGSGRFAAFKNQTIKSTNN